MGDGGAAGEGEGEAPAPAKSNSNSFCSHGRNPRPRNVKFLPRTDRKFTKIYPQKGKYQLKDIDIERFILAKVTIIFIS